MKNRLQVADLFLRLSMGICLCGVLWMAWSFVRAQEPANEIGTAVDPNNVEIEAIDSEVTGLPSTNTSTPPRGARMVQALEARHFVDQHVQQLTFGLSEIPSLQAPLFGKPRWQYLATLLYGFLAFLVSKALDWLVKSRLQRWAEQTPSKWDDILVGLADGPVKVISFVVLIHIGVHLFDWPDRIERIVTLLTTILVAFSILYVLMRAVDAAIKIWMGRLRDDGDKAFNQQFLALIGRLIKVVITLIALLTLLDNLGVEITPILGGASIVGLALGLAAQDTVGNLFGAVAVFMDRPFRVGDRIKVGNDVDGFVDQIGLRATRVRTLEGHIVTVPNKAVGSNTVVNISRRTNIRANFAVGITYNTPASRVKQATQLLEEIYRAHPNTQDVIVHFNRFGDYFLNLDVLYWCKSTDWKVFCATVQELNLTIKERFDAEGLQFAFPTRTIHMESPAGPETLQK